MSGPLVDCPGVGSPARDLRDGGPPVCPFCLLPAPINAGRVGPHQVSGVLVKLDQGGFY